MNATVREGHARAAVIVLEARYSAKGSGAVGICGAFPGSIRQHELDGEIICEKHAYPGKIGWTRDSSDIAFLADGRTVMEAAGGGSDEKGGLLGKLLEGS